MPVKNILFLQHKPLPKPYKLQLFSFKLQLIIIINLAMDNHHHFILKLSRFLPSSFSSCHFRTLPDVADNNNILHENDPSSNSPNPKKIPKYSSKLPSLCKSTPLSDAQGRKCPPFSPKIFPMQGRTHMQVASSASVVSSNSGWFTSSDEKTRRDEDAESEAFFSLSSNSGDSFRLKTSRRFKMREEMKSIDETGHCSFTSAASFDAVPGRKAAAIITKTTTKQTQVSQYKDCSPSKTEQKGSEKTELCSDHISAQLYYDSGDSRRRRAAKRRRKVKRSSSRDCSRSVMGESYAVEKRSKDPQSDFRASMVEMIVEKQIFAAEDLERLLLCFLSLNAASYHGVIFDVFSEICQTLFGN